ncbi:hypothetical protein AB0E83_16710 [Streptomyces sp. NPDC035033]|uniref:hypothetical protein n=1 Tax=Streptomyces sp. NPDC035033 TaxID=3155368 RepID=UPI0033D3D991
MRGNDVPDGFPDDLKKAQAELRRARAAYRALCESLPWSVEPAAGWPGAEHPHTHEITAGRKDSPGYTPEQAVREKELLDRVRELSIAVSTHPYWDTVERGPKRVEERMRLKNHPAVLALLDDAAPAA